MHLPQFLTLALFLIGVHVFSPVYALPANPPSDLVTRDQNTDISDQLRRAAEALYPAPRRALPGRRSLVNRNKTHRARSQFKSGSESEEARKTKVRQLVGGGISVPVEPVRDERSANEKRDSLGAVIALGAASSTYAIPIALGEPPIAYPLQLDTGSSDILLASSTCGTNCPASAANNPYYPADKFSSTFVSVNGNATTFRAHYGDGTQASGFVARERVIIGNSIMEGQAFGLVSATNLTLAQQRISGIAGFGFPRLSALVHTLLPATVPSSTSSVGAAPTPATKSPYLPPLLESLVTKGAIPYPVLGLGLRPPLGDGVTSAIATNTSTTPAAPSPSPSGRFTIDTGSFTIGGVSSQYVDANSTSGRSVENIDWHPVVPFGPFIDPATVSVQAPTSAVAKRQDAAPAPSPTQRVVDEGVPYSVQQLEAEEYMTWAIELNNVGVNGTALGLNATFAAQGVKSLALIDVGFNGIMGPPSEVAKIFAKVTNARLVNDGVWAVPCDTAATLDFTIGEKTYRLQPSDWMAAAVEGSTMCLAWPFAAQPSEDGIDWQLGTPFLKNVYTIFDYGVNGLQAPMVGFLPLSNSTTGPGPISIAPAHPGTTVKTVLPNVLLTQPAHPIPSYAFGSAPPIGALQTLGLGNASIYTAGAPAVPVIQLPAADMTSTSRPPGWPTGSNDHTNQLNGAERMGVSVGAAVVCVMAGLAWL